MSLVQQVAQMVADRGEASADDLLPGLEGCTRNQVIRGLQNAASRGLVEAARHRSGGHNIGRLPSVYRPAKPKPTPMRIGPVASVFDLGRIAAPAS